MQYKVDDVEVSKVVAKNEDATIYTNILPEGTLEAKITAKVNDIQTKQKTISNIGDVEAIEISKLKSNQVSHIIEKTAETQKEPDTEMIIQTNWLLKQTKTT